MLNPNQLSDEALALARVFAQAGSRETGSAMTLASIERSWKQSHSDLEVGLADLETARLIVRNEEQEAVVTEDGEAFFKRYYWACH